MPDDISLQPQLTPQMAALLAQSAPGGNVPGAVPDPSQPIPGIGNTYGLQPGQMIPLPPEVAYQQQQPLPMLHGVPGGQTVNPNALPPAPMPAQPPETAPQVNIPPHVPHAGSHAQPGLISEFDKQIQQQQNRQQVAGNALEAAQIQGSEDVAAAQGELAQTRKDKAAELIAKQQEIQKHNQALDAIDKANLDKAKDYTIPDFWKGRTGKLVGSTIMVALSGIGSGLLGSTKNEALDSINHNIDLYFHNQKEKIDNLYKYAEAAGRLNTQTRLQYAQDLLNLKDQHSYVLQAAADHVQEVSTKAKGAVDAANTNFLASQLSEKAIQDKMNVRELRSKLMLQEAQAEQARAAAAEHKARAAQGGYLTPAQQMQFLFKSGNEIGNAFKPVTDINKGLNKEAKDLAANIKLANEQPNNPAPFVGMMDSLVSAYSHGKVNQAQFNVWMQHIAPGSDKPEQIIEAFRTGKASPQQRKNLMDLALGKFNTVRGELKEHHDAFRQLKNGPEFASPQAQEMLNRKELEIFGTSPGFGGKEPDLGLGPAASPQGHNTVVHMKDGTTQEFDATGKRVK